MINYIEKGYGMHEHLASQGVHLIQRDNIWTANAPDENVNQLISEYNPWPAEKAAKLAELNEWFESAVSQLTAGITQTEKDSWSVQVNEAYGIRPLNMLLTMSAKRGIAVETLIDRVKEKEQAFAAHYGAIQGTRDAIEDRINLFPNSGNEELLPDLWAVKCTG
jgi:hypothetical protein